MEFTHISHLSQKVARIGLGTWAIGGWMWGGSDENQAVAAIKHGLSLGINLIDTAPIYGFGKSEEIVGKALKEFGKRDQIIVATKAAIRWDQNNIQRDSRKERILKEVEDSLRRLQISYIDLYQIHWPDTSTPFEETAEALLQLQKQGKIRAIGLSNFSVAEMEGFQQFAKIDTLQSPYNLFEREVENKELLYCQRRKIAFLAYGPLCRGLLSGKIHKGTRFEGDDLRKIDPKFQEPYFSQYLNCVDQLQQWVKRKYDRTILALSLRWLLDKGADILLWGCRKPEQLDQIESLFNWHLNAQDFQEIDSILKQTVVTAMGAEFMAPPSKENAKAHR